MKGPKRQSAAAIGEKFLRHLEAEDESDREAVLTVFGRLPDWLPEPVLPQIHQAMAALRSAQQSNRRIATLVAQERKNRLRVPGTALDVMDFIKSVNYLAHVQWAVSQGKARGIEILAGSRAAKDYKRSKAGHEAQFGTADDRLARNGDIVKRASALRVQNPRLSQNSIAKKLASGCGLSERQVKRILRETR